MRHPDDRFYYWIDPILNPDMDELAHQFVELRRSPCQQSDVNTIILASNEQEPAKFEYAGDELPDYPSCSPPLRMCSPRLKSVLEPYLDLSDGPKWIPIDAVSTSTSRTRRMYLLWFTSPKELRWLPWHKRVMASRFLPPYGYGTDLNLKVQLSIPPYVLDGKVLGTRMVTSFEESMWLFIHPEVRAHLIAEGLTDNINFTRVKVH